MDTLGAWKPLVLKKLVELDPAPLLQPDVELQHGRETRIAMIRQEDRYSKTFN